MTAAPVNISLSFIGAAPGFVDALGGALIHFLWQGVVLMLAYHALMPLCRTARQRYSIALGTLAAMAAAPLLTFAVLRADASAAWRIEGPLNAFSDPWLMWLVSGWVAGVCVLSLRMAGGWYVASSLPAHNTAALPAMLLARCEDLRERLAVSRPVRFLQSTLVHAPAVVGWVRPVVLIPASAVLRLTPAELEAVIAHELAHVRRFDLVVNFLQMAVETALFYHPAVWWISRRVRIEREHCCDDIAAAVCDPLAFAKALTTLEEWRALPQPALAFTGGLLKARVTRLLGLKAHTENGVLAAGGISALCLAAFLLANSATPRLIPVIHVPPPASIAADIRPLLVATVAIDPPARKAILPAPKPEPPRPRTLNALHAGGVSGPTEIAILKSLGVSAAYVNDIRAIWPNVTTSQIVDLHTADVAPDYVKTLQAAGINLGQVAAHNVVAYKATGVTPSLVKALQSMGIAELTPNDYTIAQVRGLTPEFLATVRKHHFTNVTLRWLIAAKKADVFG